MQFVEHSPLSCSLTPAFLFWLISHCSNVCRLRLCQRVPEPSLHFLTPSTSACLPFLPISLCPFSQGLWSPDSPLRPPSRDVALGADVGLHASGWMVLPPKGGVRCQMEMMAAGGRKPGGLQRKRYSCFRLCTHSVKIYHAVTAQDWE